MGGEVGHQPDKGGEGQESWATWRAESSSKGEPGRWGWGMFWKPGNFDVGRPGRLIILRTLPGEQRGTMRALHWVCRPSGIICLHIV